MRMHVSKWTWNQPRRRYLGAAQIHTITSMQDRSNYHIDKPNIGSYMVVESNYYVQEDTQMDDGNNENSEE